MTDKRNPSHPPDAVWDGCEHEWVPVESMMEGAVECKKCGAPGQREDADSVYWPAT